MSKTFKSEGVVFRTLKYSETSLILDIYTREYGLGSYIVSGVRKAKSQSLNLYHPMNLIDLVAYKPGESLARIKEASLAFHFQRLDREVVRSSLGTFFVDLLRSSIKEKEANEALYNYISSTLKGLDSEPISANLPIVLAIEVASHLGFHLSSDRADEDSCFDLEGGQYVDKAVQTKYVLNPHLSSKLYALQTEGRSAVIDKVSRKALLDSMMDFYRLHVEEFQELRSLPVLRAILT